MEEGVSYCVATCDWAGGCCLLACHTLRGEYGHGCCVVDFFGGSEASCSCRRVTPSRVEQFSEYGYFVVVINIANVEEKLP